MRTPWMMIGVLLLSTVSTASTDPFVGKWILNVHRSNYPPGTCPKRMVIEMATAGDGIRYHSETTYANGSTTQATYRAQYNGQEAIVTGAHGLLLPVSLKRINSHTVVASYTRLLQVTATSRRVVSADGRTMTITTVSKDRSGKRFTTLGVYQRQPDEGKISLMSNQNSRGIR